MNVLISVDMEGISGVVFPGQCSNGRPDYGRFRKLMTDETNAAVEGALAAGAKRIIVNDAHGMSNNLLLEALHPAAELISGVAKPLSMMQGIGPEIDAAFLVGYHAMAGTAAAILAHTMTDQVASVSLNGLTLGETGLNAALAGAFDVPVVLVTGDLAVTEEARSQLGEIETVAVKTGISQTAARNMHPTLAAEMIKAAAERALSLKVEPFKVELPVRARVTFKRPIHVDLAGLVPGVIRVDGCTLEFISEDVISFHKVFQTIFGLPMLEQLVS